MRYDSGVPVRLLSCSLALVLAACGAGASSTRAPSTVPLGERHPIRLERAAVVGQRAHVTSERSHREQTVTTFHGQVVDTADATSAFRFDGYVEVLAIDEHGRASELRYDVRSFTREQGGLVTELLRPGQAISLALGETREDTRLTVDAAPVSEELVHAIEEVLVVVRGESDDATLRSVEPRAVGERWPADVNVSSQRLSRRSPLRVDPGHARGEAFVRERVSVDGIDGLSIGASITADHVSIDGLAQGASLRDGRVTIEMESFFPLDEAIAPLRESSETVAQLALTMSTPQGAAEVALTMTILDRRTLEPL